jgi:hypothetical protein
LWCFVFVCLLDEELREGQRLVLKLSECGVVRKECERCVLGCVLRVGRLTFCICTC